MEGRRWRKLSSPCPSFYGLIILFYGRIIISYDPIVISLFRGRSAIIISLFPGLAIVILAIKSVHSRASSVCHLPANLLPGSLCVQTY